MTTADDQAWIKAHGVPITIDGKWGPKSQAAMIEVFRNRGAPAATPAEITMIADRYGLNARAMRAVAKVESSGAGWDSAGLLACLYERHYLFRRIRVAIPFLSDPKPGGYTIDADGDGINDNWQKLAKAAGAYGMALALECASFGRFQIMGAHWKALGYPSALDFVWRLSRTELAHYEAFALYIKENGLIGALNRVSGDPENCRAIAAGYNGSGYAAGAYHQKIAAAWKVV
jgi:hypothetical protein